MSEDETREIATGSEASSSVDEAREALADLVRNEPERHPLVIALVSPLGTDLDAVTAHLQGAFDFYNYRSEMVHLSALLDDLPYSPLNPLPKRGEKAYYEKRMDAGDMLRRDTGMGAALAAVAVGKIAGLRNNGSRPAVFILRSLKHPDELALLRHVYGDAFSLVAVSSTVDERRETLTNLLSISRDARAEAESLMARDESDADSAGFGQNVRDVFAQADVYLSATRGFPIDSEVRRFVDSIFGAPFVTPGRKEEGMKLAATASLRSSALGRQVGAALIPKIGTPVLVGTNEVPKPGGGQYWAGDVPDHRDFQTGADPNPVFVRRVIEEVLERLAQHRWLVEELRNLPGTELYHRAMEDDGGAAGPVLGGVRASSLIEFNRCLHAEQAAIINAARSGVATEGAVLYTTTFPCHECTKMIVGAGITEVNYIEPYPKSLANRLFSQLIDVEPPVRSENGLVNDRVPFRAFHGIAPRRYDTAFVAGDRRVGDRAASADPSASPRTFNWHDVAVSQREASAFVAINTVMRALAGLPLPDLTMVEEEEADGGSGDMDVAAPDGGVVFDDPPAAPGQHS